MRLLIVEDEALVAQRIERLSRDILGSELELLQVKPTLEAAWHYLHSSPIDLLILDLNLNGKNGFELLEDAVTRSFHTIILSANTDQAIRAFEYGVLDFVPKPFGKERLAKAFARYHQRDTQGEYATKYLAVRQRQGLRLIPITEVSYIQGANNNAILWLDDGTKALHDKSLQQLEQLLPTPFERVHKSYIVNWDKVSGLGSQYDIYLQNGLKVPISRIKYKALKAKLT